MVHWKGVGHLSDGVVTRVVQFQFPGKACDIRGSVDFESPDSTLKFK